MAKELEYFEEIVNQNSELNGGWTPLLWASQKCNVELAQILVENGAATNIPKSDGFNILHISASNNDIHMLDYFLQQEDIGIDVNAMNKDGWTPAHLAGFLNNFDSLNLLMENGADVCAKQGNNLKVYEEITRADNADLLECIYNPYVVTD